MRQIPQSSPFLCRPSQRECTADVNGVDIEELVIGVKKADLDEIKELKVKLPVRLLVNLQCVKLTERRSVSDIVNVALTEHFVGLARARHAKLVDSAGVVAAPEGFLDRSVSSPTRVETLVMQR